MFNWKLLSMSFFNVINMVFLCKLEQNNELRTMSKFA